MGLCGEHNNIALQEAANLSSCSKSISKVLCKQSTEACSKLGKRMLLTSVRSFPSTTPGKESYIGSKHKTPSPGSVNNRINRETEYITEGLYKIQSSSTLALYLLSNHDAIEPLKS